MKNKEKEIDFNEKTFKQRFKKIDRQVRPAITLKDETKERITIYLDPVIIAYYKKAAEGSGVGYQTLINRVLRQSVENESTIPEHIKDNLLNDRQFLQNLKSALSTNL